MSRKRGFGKRTRGGYKRKVQKRRVNGELAATRFSDIGQVNSKFPYLTHGAAKEAAQRLGPTIAIFRCKGNKKCPNTPHWHLGNSKTQGRKRRKRR